MWTLLAMLQRLKVAGQGRQMRLQSASLASQEMFIRWRVCQGEALKTMRHLCILLCKKAARELAERVLAQGIRSAALLLCALRQKAIDLFNSNLTGSLPERKDIDIKTCESCAPWYLVKLFKRFDWPSEVTKGPSPYAHKVFHQSSSFVRTRWNIIF